MRRTLAVALMLMGIAGCGPVVRGVGRAGFAIAMVRLPITIPLPVVNKRLSRETREQLDACELAVSADGDRGAGLRRLRADGRVNLLQPPPRSESWVVGQVLRLLNLVPYEYNVFKRSEERLDIFEDLRDRHTVVMVCFSGGGARAASMGRHVMGQLERAYNQANPRTDKHLIDSVDAYSSVSGGSIYASHIAAQHLEGRTRTATTFSTTLTTSLRVRLGTAYTGFTATLAYVSPGNILFFPLATLTAEFSYLDQLAHALNITQKGGWVPRASGHRLGQVDPTPRFYFNAVCQEAGAPFVITQSLLHLPSEFPQTTAVADWDARAPAADPSRLAPLHDSLLLEDIGSSPAKFPLVYAAMASAAFPVGLDPIPVRKHDYVPSEQVYRRSGTLLHLIDGGVYDNSGVATAMSLFEHLVHTTKVRRLVLLEVDAETTEYDVQAAVQASKPFNWLKLLAPENYLIIRGLIPAGESLSLMHTLGQRSVQHEAWRRLARLREQHPQVECLHFPVSLRHLSPRRRRLAEADADLFGAVRRIQTDYTIGPEEDELLSKAVHRLLTGGRVEPPPKPHRGDDVSACRCSSAWRVGPGGGVLRRLDHAFACAVVRAHQREWTAEPKWTFPGAPIR